MSYPVSSRVSRSMVGGHALKALSLERLSLVAAEKENPSF